MKKSIFKSALMLFCAGLLFVSCSDDKNEPDSTSLDAYKKALLTQYVNGVVVPTYKSLADESIALSELCTRLADSPSQSLVQQACDKWIEARKYWELSEAFLFGAAGDYYIDPHIDSWPLQKDKLDGVLANAALIAELKEDGASADGFASLGYGLLGFHAIEYVLFRDGHARNVSDINENELIYNAAVAEDLANQTARLEAAWAGFDNVSAKKQQMLDDAELKPSFNYGEAMINAGLPGNVSYKTQLDAMVELMQGASDITDEVANTKMQDPIDSQNVLDVESWYSWNSYADFTDNLRSVRNAYYGSINGSVNSNSIASFMAKNYPSQDNAVRKALGEAISAMEALSADKNEPFRNHLDAAYNKEAQDACNALLKELDLAIEAIQ
ncbi:MAG: peptidase M75 [Muribaculaceae bacterium]|nr:peptidase M75 [Muribaculaceae bacterium]